MNKQKILKIRKLVEAAAKSKRNYFHYSAWTHHVVLVEKYGLELAKKLKADKEVVWLSCLLHDYATFLDKKLYPQHHIHSKKLARKILLDFNFPEETIKKVEECIYCHRGSVPRKKFSLEARILADADAASHFAVLDDLFYLAYGVHGLETDEGRKFVLNKLARSYQKMSPLAKDLVREKYKLIKKVLKE